ncbi:MAG: DMT family transporter [Oscillospiraceae bacterium]|nr:DMT family transporter [Oscillospiraceae bacterium]
MKKTQFRGIIILFAAAFIWGSSFVAQSIGMEIIEAFTYNGIRTLMGAAVLLPIVASKEIKELRSALPEKRKDIKRKNLSQWKYGVLPGLALCVASNFQQFAFIYSTPGKIAFITALYMLFVPIIELFLGKRAPKLMWICVAAGAAGLYFLSLPSGQFTGLNLGDVLSLICAVFFAVHIILIDRYSADIDPVKLSFMQFTTSGVISCVLMFIFETPNTEAINSAILPLLYSGLLSCGIAYTFQIIGQKHTEPTLASLIMCMESVFGVLSAAVVLHQIPTSREVSGCVLMFAAIIAAQFSDKFNPRRKQNP